MSGSPHSGCSQASLLHSAPCPETPRMGSCAAPLSLSLNLLGQQQQNHRPLVLQTNLGIQIIFYFLQGNCSKCSHAGWEGAQSSMASVVLFFKDKGFLRNPVLFTAPLLAVIAFAFLLSSVFQSGGWKLGGSWVVAGWKLGGSWVKQGGSWARSVLSCAHSVLACT